MKWARQGLNHWRAELEMQVEEGNARNAEASGNPALLNCKRPNGQEDNRIV
jgi:hypothetical protein